MKQMVVTKEQLLAIMPNATKVVDKYLPVINKYSKEFGITTKSRMAFFLANVAHESGEMRYVVENMNYSATGLVKTWPSRFSNKSGVAGKCYASNYAYKPEAIANVVYANRMGNGDKDSGDGWKYRGRGFFGLTGKDNYKAYQTYLRKGGMDVDLLANPELLEQPVGAVKSAMFFIAIITLPFALDEWDSVWSFLMCCGIAFVGAAPNFRGSEHNIHYISALVSAVCSLVWVAHVCPDCYYLMFIGLALYILDTKRWLLYGELTCFSMVYISLIIGG